MKSKKFLLPLFLIIGVWGVLNFCPIAHGATTGDVLIKNLQEGAGEKGAGLPEARDPRQVAGTIIRSALGLLGIIFVGLIVYAGFLWMTAGGNDDAISKAKGYIFNAVIGLVIVLSAYMITIYAFKLGLTSYGEKNCSSASDCNDKNKKCNVYGKCVDKDWCNSDGDCASGQICDGSTCTTNKNLGNYFD